MKILLISFQNNTDVIGLKYINSSLIMNRMDSQILFLPGYLPKDNDTILDFVSSIAPDIIGISLMSPEFNDARNLSAAINKAFPEQIIVWGGAHPTVAPQDCVKYSDYVFMGESEEAFIEFVKCYEKRDDVRNVPNLAYSTDGGTITNKLRPLCKDIDCFPFPEHMPKESHILHNGKIFPMNKKLFKQHTRYSGRFYSLVTTRGCPFSCAYCCNSAFAKLYGKTTVRKRSVCNVIDELKQAIKLHPDIVYINIQDDNFFSYDEQWMTDFSIEYKKHIGKNFICRTTPAHVTSDKVRLLKDAGLSWVFMGLQSGSERVNSQVFKRHVTNDRFLKSAEIINKFHLACYYDIILDNPYETESDLLETIKTALMIPKPFAIQLFSLCFYQGTELYDRAEKEKIGIEDPLLKNYGRYKQTYLNRVIRLIPILPKWIISLLVKINGFILSGPLLSLIYYPSVAFLEPWLYIRLVFMSFNNDIPKAISMIASFSKTGFVKLFLRK